MGRNKAEVDSLETRRLMSAGGASAQVDAPPGDAAPIFVAATPQPTDGGVTLTETAGQRFTARLGEFKFKTVDEALVAQINWGDGRFSKGVLVGSYATGEYYVFGSHDYRDVGKYNVTVKVFARPIGSPAHPTQPVAQFASIVDVKPLQPSDGGLNLTEPAGKRFTTKLGEFTYKTVDQSLDAVIDWGDGRFSKGVLDGSYATGEYYVLGSHTYAHAGNYKVQVRIFARPIGTPVHPTAPVAQFTSVIKAVESN